MFEGLANPKCLLWLAIVLVLAVAVTLLAVRLYNSRAYHFAEIQPGVLYREGMRSPAQFLRSCQRAKIKTVISLVSPEEIGNERFAPALAACRERGIKTLQVAIPLGGWPTSENVQAFLKLAEEAANQPVLVHCREGVRRTGMMSSAFRLSAMGMTKEQAKAAIETFGHSRRSIGNVELFIDAYDPKARTVNYPSLPATNPDAE